MAQELEAGILGEEKLKEDRVLHSLGVASELKKSVLQSQFFEITISLLFENGNILIKLAKIFQNLLDGFFTKIS